MARGRSFAQDQDEDDVNVDSMGEPVQAISEYSFRCIHADNPVRKVCIKISMSP
jgi:hypothetical protein